MIYSLFTDMSRCTSDEVRRLLSLVSEEQRVEALKFKHTFGQFTTLKSLLMLKELLVENHLVPSADPLRFGYNSHGKPHLADFTDIHFNISHCPNAIAVAIDDAPIGVDVERFVMPSDSLLSYCMNDNEAQQVRQSAQPERTFASFWTQKEALFKQRGTASPTNSAKCWHTHTLILYWKQKYSTSSSLPSLLPPPADSAILH